MTKTSVALTTFGHTDVNTPIIAKIVLPQPRDTQMRQLSIKIWVVQLLRSGAAASEK